MSVDSDKARELKKQFGVNAKYVVLEIMDELKKYGDKSSIIERLSFWKYVKEHIDYIDDGFMTL